MDEMCFLGLAFSVFPKRSKTVGSGAPNCAGSRSRKSMNSFLQIRSANFLGTGGELGSTLIASVECVVREALRLANGVLRETSGGGSLGLEGAIVCMPVRAWGLGSCASELSAVLCVCWAPVGYE